MGGETVWRFPVESIKDFSSKGVSSNLTSEATTLYKNAKKESSYNKVSVQQNVIVAKSVEKKAAEAADPELVLVDGVHPSLFGHQLIADQYLKYAGELLK